MALSDIVVVSITASTVRISAVGFGTPLILQYHTHNVDRVREYASVAEMVTDGFAVYEPAYIAASRIFSQTNPPATVKVGRLALAPTQRFAVTPTAIDSHVYRAEFGRPSTTLLKSAITTAASDGSASVSEVNVLLKTQIDALSADVTVSDQTTYLRILSNTAGKFFTFKPDNLSELQVVQDHADPGLATDLAAIAVVDNDWYAILFPGFMSKDCAAAIAGYAETNKKLFLCGTQDGDILTSSTTDAAYVAKAASRKYTAVFFHPETDGMVDAAIAGDCLPRAPGSENWMFKNLSGPPAYTLTSTQRSNALGKNCNLYTTYAGVAVTEKGTSAHGQFIDITRGLDWLEARIQERFVTRLMNASKIPFTDAGAAVFEAELRAQLTEAVEVGLLAADPAFTITMPKVADVSSTDRAARHYKTMKFSANLAGAMNKVTILGNVEV